MLHNALTDRGDWQTIPNIVSSYLAFVTYADHSGKRVHQKCMVRRQSPHCCTCICACMLPHVLPEVRSRPAWWILTASLSRWGRSIWRFVSRGLSVWPFSSHKSSFYLLRPKRWANLTMMSHERTCVQFLVLPGSQFSFTEITEYPYISLIDFNVSYSSCWGYSLISTLKLKKIYTYRPWLNLNIKLTKILYHSF